MSQFIDEDLQAQFISHETPHLLYGDRQGCFMTYEIPIEIDIYPRRSNTPVNVDKFTQNQGCEGAI